MQKEKKQKPHHDVNWYKDKYQSVIVLRNWMFLITVLCLMAILVMTAGAFYFVPLKSVEPFVIQIDERTGATEVVASKDYKKYTADDMLIKYFATRYMQARESYNYRLSPFDYEYVVRLNSSVDVYNIFKREVDKLNPTSPYNIFGTKAEKTVNLTSFSFSSKDSKQGERDIIANMQVIEQSYIQGRTVNVYNITVRMTALFKNDYSLSDQERLINPLGFVVTSYRVDRDLR